MRKKEHKLKRKVKIIMVLTLLALLIGLIIIFMLYKMEKNSDNKRYYSRGIEDVPQADYILVPGAKIMVSTPEKYLKDRLDYAYELYQKGKASKIIVSGGFDEEENKYESEVMAIYLIMRGIDINDIIIDYSGTNTYATIKRAKEYVGDKSIIFCTQELHSARALYLAKHLSLDMVVYCSDPIIYSNRGKKILRETLAKIKAIINCNIYVTDVFSIKEKPFYCNGEKIFK